MKVRIDSIRLINSEKSPNLKASCQVVINELITINGVLLKQSKENENLYVEMPKRRNANGEYVDVANPTTTELSANIKEEVLRAYELLNDYTPYETHALSNEPIKFNLHASSRENGGSTKAYGDMWIGQDFVIHNVTIREGIVNGENKIFVGMPSRQDDKGEWWNYVYPTNDEAKERINKCGFSAYKNTQKQSIGNVTYKEMKESNADLSVYHNQNVKYGEKIGEALTALGVKWTGFIDSKGISIVVNARDADMYANAVKAVSDVDKSKDVQKETQRAAVVEESTEVYEIDDDYPF